MAIRILAECRNCRYGHFDGFNSDCRLNPKRVEKDKDDWCSHFVPSRAEAERFNVSHEHLSMFFTVEWPN
jgi:hypothetical protein